MKLVLLFFCAILFLIIFTIILLILSTIKLNIVNINISNFSSGEKKKKLEKDFLIYVELYLFGKVKIAKVKITKKLIEKLHILNNMKDIKKDVKMAKRIKTLGIIKELKIKIEKLNMEAQIGTEELLTTVFLVTLISSLFAIIFRNCEYKNIKYKIIPLYKYGNAINFRINCIINVKMVHIIHVIYILLKKGMIKNERTSNRRTYDYSYE